MVAYSFGLLGGPGRSCLNERKDSKSTPKSTLFTTLAGANHQASSHLGFCALWRTELPELWAEAVSLTPGIPHRTFRSQALLKESATVKGTSFFRFRSIILPGIDLKSLPSKLFDQRLEPTAWVAGFPSGNTLATSRCAWSSLGTESTTA